MCNMYKVVLRKEETYFWDEDHVGICIFNADDDEQAIAFIATIVQSMNRKYWRMNEPRNVHIDSIYKITRDGFKNKYELLNLWNRIKPLEGFRSIRSALEDFYFKDDNGRNSMMHMFSDYKPVPRFT